ncbi:MAG: DUF2508 family protein [Halanaerobiaceae bacterium]
MAFFDGWLENVIKKKLKPFLVDDDAFDNGVVDQQEEINFSVSDEELAVEIEKAHRQWIRAQKYFQSVSEPKLVDHASYKIQAAQTKYMYLLNKARLQKEVEANSE